MSVAAGGSECGGRPRPWRGGGWRRCDGWPLVWCRWRGASRAAARSAGCCVLCPKVLSAARKSPPPSAAQPVSRRPCKAHCAKGGSPSKKVKTVYTLAELGGERGGATERREELVEGGGESDCLKTRVFRAHACVCFVRMFASQVGRGRRVGELPPAASKPRPFGAAAAAVVRLGGCIHLCARRCCNEIGGCAPCSPPPGAAPEGD